MKGAVRSSLPRGSKHCIVIKNTFEYRFLKAPGRFDHPGTVRASSDEHPFASLTDDSLRASAIGLRCLLTGAQRP